MDIGQGRYFEDFVVGEVYRHVAGRTATQTGNIWWSLLTQNAPHSTSTPATGAPSVEIPVAVVGKPSRHSSRSPSDLYGP
ncbi:hypothetical protein NDR87_32675 [Nocardia sp. CDC159]|uniref:Uncharacterized protein n=1 Tax=Nocardia pulmonis TaxID=2951408 RepID=A0A9X2ED38_9NOCA|nr:MULTISPECIES: hypothetical protein [Nocardia]MCM6778249.1 hypothetical protein [Nocardia pulmonis]MCM6791138.1 hypothetical protein [Nocardia sp. CDC159]